MRTISIRRLKYSSNLSRSSITGTVGSSLTLTPSTCSQVTTETSLLNCQITSKRLTLYLVRISMKKPSKRWSKKFNRSTSKLMTKLRDAAKSHWPKIWDPGHRRNSRCKTWTRMRSSSRIRIDACSPWCSKMPLPGRRNRAVTNLSRCNHRRLSQQQSQIARKANTRRKLTQRWTRRRHRGSRDREIMRITTRTSTTWCLRSLNSWTINTLKSIIRLKMRASKRHKFAVQDRSKETKGTNDKANREAHTHTLLWKLLLQLCWSMTLPQHTATAVTRSKKNAITSSRAFLRRVEVLKGQLGVMVILRQSTSIELMIQTRLTTTAWTRGRRESQLSLLEESVHKDKTLTTICLLTVLTERLTEESRSKTIPGQYWTSLSRTITRYCLQSKLEDSKGLIQSRTFLRVSTSVPRTSLFLRDRLSSTTVSTAPTLPQSRSTNGKMIQLISDLTLVDLVDRRTDIASQIQHLYSTSRQSPRPAILPTNDLTVLRQRLREWVTITTGIWTAEGT